MDEAARLIKLKGRMTRYENKLFDALYWNTHRLAIRQVKLIERIYNVRQEIAAIDDEIREQQHIH